MFLIILILAIYITVKSISYAIYEIKENKNKIGGSIIIVLSVLLLFATPILDYFH